MIKRSEENYSLFVDFVAKNDWIEFLAEIPETRSNTSVCFKVDMDSEQLKKFIKILADEKVCYDCKSYKDAPPGLRFWCGGTIEKEDIIAVIPWLEWAYSEVK